MTGPRDIGADHNDHNDRNERRELGESSESVVAAFLRDVDGHEILTQHTPGPRGSTSRAWGRTGASTSRRSRAPPPPTGARRARPATSSTGR